MLLRNPEMMLLDTFEDPQFIHDVMRRGHRLLQALGRRHREDRDRAQLLRADRLHQPDLAGQLPRVHRALPQGAGRPLQGQEGRRHHPHLRHHLSDLRGPDPAAASPPSPSTSTSRPIPTLHVDQLARFMEVAKGRAVAIGNVDATKFEKTTREADGRRRASAASTPPPGTRASSCRRPARSRRGRIPRS